MTAANVLLSAVHAALRADAALTALIGAGGIRDRLEPRAAMPHILMGDMDSRDYSTATEEGEEHLLTLEIWSDAPGRREGQTIAACVKRLLHDAALPLTGVTLVNLQLTVTRTRREGKGRYTVTDMRFRAVTE